VCVLCFRPGAVRTGDRCVRGAGQGGQGGGGGPQAAAQAHEEQHGAAHAHRGQGSTRYSKFTSTMTSVFFFFRSVLYSVTFNQGCVSGLI
jgi:hypothetical protein